MDSNAGVAPVMVEEAGATPAQESSVALLFPSLASLDTTASAADIAERDLSASLQLLANRMQFLTGASSATIALRTGEQFLCRASAGSVAAEVGSPLRADVSLVIECIEMQQIICCNDTADGTSPDGRTYASLGIKSMMMMPLIRDSEVIGIIELLADRTQAFRDGDGAVLERLGEMVKTALEHAGAAERASSAIRQAEERFAEELAVPAEVSSPEISSEAAKPEPITLHTCEACGFPISAGRKLCLDCEEARANADGTGTAPAFLADLAREQNQSWLQTHFYTIGTFLIVLLTVVLVMLKLR